MYILLDGSRPVATADTPEELTHMKQGLNHPVVFEVPHLEQKCKDGFCELSRPTTLQDRKSLYFDEV